MPGPLQPRYVIQYIKVNNETGRLELKETTFKTHRDLCTKEDIPGIAELNRASMQRLVYDYYPDGTWKCRAGQRLRQRYAHIMIRRLLKTANTSV